MSKNRSSNTYQKINTVFYRDEKNVIMPNDEFTQKEFEFLRNCLLEASEKIDGMNIRLEVTRTIETSQDSVTAEETALLGVSFTLDYKGKSDNAVIPPMLLEHLKTNYTEEKVLNALGLKKFIPCSEWKEHKWETVSDIPYKYTIYGEGYGAKIQSGGYYCKDNRFIVFDVKVNELYLLSEARDAIAEKLGAAVVPLIGYMTIDEAIAFVKKGFNSKIAEEEHLAEGLVLKTPLGLKNRRDERLITKIKTQDFVKWDAVYGKLDPSEVKQIRNPKLSE